MRLIDADLLRKNMEFVCMGIMAGTEPYNAPLTEIDNAPTVELEVKKVPIASVTFDTEKLKELTDGIVESIKNGELVLQDERPQGEWIAGENGNIKCNQCGCEIRYSYLISGNPDFPKFCCDCGADMRKKKKLDYKVINRGKCMLCGKELTEGLFFCKECEGKGKGGAE